MTATKHSSKPAPAGHGHDEHLYDEMHNEDVAHEHSDVNVRGLIVFAFGLAAVVGVCALAMYGLFIVFESRAAANDKLISPLALPQGQQPPEPRLLLNEPQNLRNFRTSQAEALKGIDDAKKRLLEQGL